MLVVNLSCGRSLNREGRVPARRSTDATTDGGGAARGVPSVNRANLLGENQRDVGGPAMVIPLDLDRAGHPAGVRYPLFDLVRDNFLVAKNSHLIEIGEPEGDGLARIGFRLPESSSSS